MPAQKEDPRWGDLDAKIIRVASYVFLALLVLKLFILEIKSLFGSTG
jgi:hypothetical protein